MIRRAYAPNRNEPMEVVSQLDGRGERLPRNCFNFDAMLSRMHPARVMAGICGEWDTPFGADHRSSRTGYKWGNILDFCLHRGSEQGCG